MASSASQQDKSKTIVFPSAAKDLAFLHFRKGLYGKRSSGFPRPVFDAIAPISVPSVACVVNVPAPRTLHPVP